MSVAKGTRRKVLARDQHQCRFILEPGVRCSARDDLTLHHIVAVRDKGHDGMLNLVTVCHEHHVLIERVSAERRRQDSMWGPGSGGGTPPLPTPQQSRLTRIKAGFRHRKDCLPGECVYGCEVGSP